MAYNKTIIIGRLTGNPTKTKIDGKSVAKFHIFNNSINPKTGEETVKTMPIIAIGRQADVCVRYLSKGDLCCIEGTLKTSECNQKLVVCDKITFLTGRKIETSEGV